MFKIILSVMLLVSIKSFAQDTNKFPPTGNFAGLGTLNPENSEGWETAFEVKGPTTSKSLTSTNSVITGTWSHNLGYYGAPAGGISGTFTNHPYSFITNKLARMVISTTGNIGIGTTNPRALLDISTNSIFGDEKGALKLRSTTAEQFMYASYLDAYNAGSIQVIKPGIGTQNLLLNPQGGNVGIGTVTPTDLLQLDAGNTRTGLTITGQGDANAYTDIQLYIKDKSIVPTGSPFGWLISHRKDGYFSNSGSAGSSLEFYSVNSGGGYFAPLSFKSNGDVILVSDKNTNASGNVSIGTTDAKGYKLAVNGSVIATSMTVKLNAAWPDYVFEKDYSLLSLNELEQYLLKNKHLPDMPSAKEIETTGQNLGQINSTLLKNVEELTLHLIEKDKQLQQQQKMIDLQNQRIEKLENSLTEILKKIK